jgi:Domain of unknown function (DUF4340)
MNRKSLIAIAAFAVLGLVALFSLRQPEKGEGTADRQRPLAKIAAADLDTIQILQGGVTTTLKRPGGSGGKISVTTPVAYPADEANAKSAFEQIEKLELGDLVTENKARQAEFQVDDAKALHIIAKSEKSGGKVLADLLVGKVVGSGTMVRIAGKDEVWQAGGGLRGAFEHPTADWRDRSITTFSQGDAEMLTVKMKDGSTVIVKKAGGEDKFDLVTSVPKLAATDKLDNTVPAGVLSGLSAWKANDFADGAAASVTGLDAPTMTLVVALKGGKNVTALVGNKKSDDEIYVKRADAPQVFVVKKFNLERIYKRPVEFKDKTVCDIAEADLAEVAVTNGADSYTLLNEGGKWKAAKFEVDPSRTPSIGGGFKEWKGNGIAEETPAAVGLAKPKATIVAKSKKGVTCALKLGDESKDKQYVFSQTAKSADIYMLPKWSVDRILVKVDDLKKKK